MIGRVTVTLPVELLRDMDRRESNRSKFVTRAVRAELERLRREELRRSLADEGFEAWTAGLPDESGESLFDVNRAKPVRWVPGEGWVEE